MQLDSLDLSTIRQKFHYEQADTPRQLLGGLKPRLPLSEVYSFTYKGRCMHTTDGMLQAYYSLVAKAGDTLLLIDTEEKFKKVFIPIDDEQEAVSYTAYLTKTHPRYDIVKQPRYRIYSSNFPSTYAKRVAGGYEVLLHYKRVFGCGPHPYFYRIYKVTEAGEITSLHEVKMYEDPEEDALCVD